MKKLFLQVVGEESIRHELPSSGMLVIGCSPQRAGFVIEGQGVEDAHCAIGAIKGGGWAVKDLGSRYGTMVNGKTVSSQRIAEGDTLMLGSRRLSVVDAAKPDAPDERPAEAPASDPAPAQPAVAEAGQGPGKAQVGIPKRVGGYRVVRLLGRGGMGTVLLAEQESLHRPVALKLLPPRLAADADFVARFQKEARAAAALSHPNVVIIHDVGEADGLHFLSMEYMDAGSLEDRIKREGPLPWREVLDILHDAARGLMFAEEKDIIHRDIKPANLMRNAAGTVKIADLGLATNAESEIPEAGGRKILGTPHFISPEQARGETLDHRADLYSLGATVFLLLTGRTPFEGDTTREILRAHFTAAPPSPRGLVPQVPEDLDALVLRLLAKNPDDRPRSAQFLLAEVDRLRLQADHGHAPAAPAGARKGPPLALLGGVCVLVLAGLAALALLGGGSDPEPAITADSEDPTDGDREDPGDPDSTGADDGALFGSDDDVESPDAGADLEAQLRQRDLLAENAYLRIDATLTKPERIDMLLGLAEEFPGTDTADQVRLEIVALREEFATEQAAAAEKNALLASTRASLLALCGLPTPEGTLPRPGDQLRQAASFSAPAGLPEDVARALSSAVLDEIVSAARLAFRGELDRADDLATKGRFEEVRTILTDLLQRMDLPEFPLADQPLGYTELKVLGDGVRGQLTRLDQDAQRWASHRIQADRQALATALQANAPLRRALTELDLSKAEELLAELADSLATDQARALVASLSSDAKAGRSLLLTLTNEHASGGWRRRTVSDPRVARSTARDIVAVDASGLVIEVRGVTESLPWTAFGARTDALSGLLKERLSREYTAEEREGVVGLLRIAAALESAKLAAQMLEPGSEAHFSQAESAAMLELHDRLQTWVRESPRFARERDAARTLAEALVSLESEVWSAAEAGLQELLDSFGDTLLVACLSDGTPLDVETQEDEP